MRSLIIYCLVLACFMPAAARDQKVVMFQESENGDRRAEVQINLEDGSIIAGCRSSSKSNDYEAYWMKSEKNGNRICVERSKRDDVTRGHYLQKSADGSSLTASYESSPERPDRVSFLLRGSAGNELPITRENEGALLRRMFNMDREMNIYMKGIQKNLP